MWLLKWATEVTIRNKTTILDQMNYSICGFKKSVTHGKFARVPMVRLTCPRHQRKVVRGFMIRLTCPGHLLSLSVIEFRDGLPISKYHVVNVIQLFIHIRRNEDHTFCGLSRRISYALYLIFLSKCMTFNNLEICTTFGYIVSVIVFELPNFKNDYWNDITKSCAYLQLQDVSPRGFNRDHYNVR